MGVQMNLCELNVSQNRLMALPRSLARMMRLRVLNASANGITADGVPAELLRDSNIHTLVLDANPVAADGGFARLDGYDVYDRRGASARRKLD